MRLEGQIIVYTARVDRIESLIADSSLDFDIYQDGNDVVVDIYYTFGFMESELRISIHEYSANGDHQLCGDVEI